MPVTRDRPEIGVRQALPEDMPQIRALANEFSQPHIDVEQLRMDGDITFLVAFRDGEMAGFWGLINRGSNVGEVHTVMSRRMRGPLAVDAGRKALSLAFVAIGFDELTSVCPADNDASFVFATALGIRLDRRDRKERRVCLTIDEWMRDGGHLTWRAVGSTFHDLLGEDNTDHEDDDNHDAAVGLAWVLGSFDPERAERLYNRWAATYGYAPVSFLASGDDFLLVDIHSCLLKLGLFPDLTLQRIT